MNNGFNNLSLTTSFQNIQGSNKYKVKTLDFDTCGDCCNITACDGGVISFCAKVKFKEGFIFDGDICDIDGGATFKDFTATEGYYLEALASTCANPIARTRAVSYFTDLAGPSLSTVFRNYAGTQGDAKLIINSTSTQPTLNPATDNYGMIIKGGDLANTKNLRIETDGTLGGAIEIFSKDDITIESGDAVIIEAENDVSIISKTGKVYMEATAGEINSFAILDNIIKSINGDVDITTTSPTSHIRVVSAGSAQFGSAEGQLEIVTGINVTSVPAMLIHALKGDVNINGGPGAGADVDDLKLTAPGGHIEILSKDTITINSGVGGVGAGDVNIKALTGLGEVILDASARVRIPSANVLNIAQTNRFPPAGTDASQGKTGDRAGDICYSQGQTVGLSKVGYLYVCYEDYPGPPLQSIWGRVQLLSW